MSTRQNTVRGGFLRRALATFGAAASAAAAIEGGRRPSKRDLDTLGIDAEAFSQIKIV